MATSNADMSAGNADMNAGNDQARALQRVIAQAWSDDSFKQRLMAEPTRVLADNGIQVPDGTEVRVVENTDRVFYLPIPPKPAEDLSDEQLDQAAGGTFCGGVCSLSFC